MVKPISCKLSTSKINGYEFLSKCKNNYLHSDIDVCFFPKGFSPGITDVIIGRGKKCHGHRGNKRLKYIVISRLEEYSEAALQSEKSQILRSIVGLIRNNHAHANAGGFVKLDPKTNRWFDVGDNLAREKISKAFRDALTKRQSCSNRIYANTSFMPNSSLSSQFEINSFSQTLERDQFNCFSQCSAVISDDSESSEASYIESQYEIEPSYLSSSFFEQQLESEPLNKNDNMNFDSVFKTEEMDEGHFAVDLDDFTLESDMLETEKKVDSSVLDDIDIQGLESNELRTPLHDDFFSCHYSPFMVQKATAKVTNDTKKSLSSMAYASNRKCIKQFFESLDDSAAKKRSSQLNIITSKQA